jgi:hypothetical protein
VKDILVGFLHRKCAGSSLHQSAKHHPIAM